MNGPLDSLSRLNDEGLLRKLRPLDSPAGPRVSREGRTLWNFSSNDYLGLAGHPGIASALIEGVHRYGAGAAASRLVSGTLPPHRVLEEALAEAKQTEAALVFSSGFATSLGVIPAVVRSGDHVIIDKLSHASLVDGARLSGATMRIFPHNDLAKLEKLLTTIRAKDASGRILVVTESVFSMDGDLCPLRTIVELTERYDALLLLDEAHAFGVLGENGMGLAELESLQQRITFQMGTFSKAAGLSGGYIATSRAWADLLINQSRSFIYSTAPLPSLAHATLESLRLIRSDEGRQLRKSLAENISAVSTGMTAIVPVVLCGNEAAIAASSSLEENGFLVPAIRFPTVPRGAARLRVSISAAHPHEAVDALAGYLNQLRS